MYFYGSECKEVFPKIVFQNPSSFIDLKTIHICYSCFITQFRLYSIFLFKLIFNFIFLSLQVSFLKDIELKQVKNTCKNAIECYISLSQNIYSDQITPYVFIFKICIYIQSKMEKGFGSHQFFNQLQLYLLFVCTKFHS